MALTKLNSLGITDGTIVNADISASAAIASTKLSGVNDAKAWVKFNGTGTPAIDASFNVSSLTDHTDGQYSINFTTAFSDSNYCAVYSCRNPAAHYHGVSEDGNTIVRSTTAVRIIVWKHDNSSGTDTAVVSAAFFR